MQKLIKTILAQSNYGWLAENQKAFRFFKKSDYWQYLKEDIAKMGKDSPELEDNVCNYAGLFAEASRFLNLF